MKSTPTKATLALFTLTALAAIAATEQSPRAVLGKINFQALYAAAPGVPATAPEAAKRAYGAVVEEHSDTAALDKFYAPFQMQVVAARNKIQGASDISPIFSTPPILLISGLAFACAMARLPRASDLVDCESKAPWILLRAATTDWTNRRGTTGEKEHRRKCRRLGLAEGS